ncbi:MAG TPA: hypothetical protein VHS76_10450 [Steroidobacteraceae bacterium]|nr:hypothetical protein [Steroidobacteraceae bacterium]
MKKPPPESSSRGGFKLLRILILLLVLLIVSLSTWLDRYRSTRWQVPLYVAIYPIAADASPVTLTYVAALDAERFKPIDRFFMHEAARYRLNTGEPVRTRLRSALHDKPPQRAPTAGLLATAWWSLRLRYWAWRASGHVDEPEDIRMFVLYHDPALTPEVPHSLGLTKGLIGVVYAFASAEMDGENNVVIAHELLHTVGAGDKYLPDTDAPRFPDGYGDPHQVPLYPQRAAEIMAGRRMLSADRWQQAASLDEVLIGPATALEIRWPEHAY